MNSDQPRRLAVFSDIHGNLHALQAVMDYVDAMQLDAMVCCGDVVGYGAFPNECINLLREREIPTLAGNHDHAALGLTDVQFFNDIAKRAIVWTQSHLTEQNSEWLRQRPYTMELTDQFYFSHASPHQPDQWGYVLTFGDARLCFSEFAHQFCFIGHSHQPAIVELNGLQLSCPDAMVVPVTVGRRYLINVGSVGQPRDRNPDACFVTVDLEEAMIQFHRVPYDIQAAQAAIVANGLPDELSDRLSLGW